MKKQNINIIIILLGAMVLIYSLMGESTNVYLQILGIVLLMFGLYTASKNWVGEKPKNHTFVEEEIEEEPIEKKPAKHDN
ncbi:hypothetical protein GGR32_001496 [Mesonia hippocampi]|uniref:Uncharacterized protein n=1 Tax=Mesonia hippocampi TaxID=1628250 RepID=A0A840EQE7_9FLAO|nr:hypothetical protein [Mesonia hippocampi]MBB4119200.1 hypothetical protein [Mesonia hippocampi]